MNNENIKVLEEYIKNLTFDKPIHNVIPDWATIGKEEIQAIENLIKRNKDLEEQNEESIKALEEWINGERTSNFHILKSDITSKIYQLKDILETNLYYTHQIYAKPESILQAQIEILEKLLKGE